MKTPESAQPQEPEESAPEGMIDMSNDYIMFIADDRNVILMPACTDVEIKLSLDQVLEIAQRLKTLFPEKIK